MVRLVYSWGRELISGGWAGFEKGGGEGVGWWSGLPACGFGALLVCHGLGRRCGRRPSICNLSERFGVSCSIRVTRW